MVKRLFWFAIGAGVGIGASRRIHHGLRDTRDHYRPERVVRRLSTDIRLAVDEGRKAMTERESELRTQQVRRYAGPTS